MLSKLKILIVEDELSFAIELQMLVQEAGYEVLARVDNSAAALEKIIGHKPDMVLMDIDIKGEMSGLEVAEAVQHLKVPILFITSMADPEKFEKSKELNAIGYLVKPINKISLHSAIEMAVKTLDIQQELEAAFSTEDEIFVKKGNTYLRVHIDHITHIQASGDYCKLCTPNGEFLVSLRMSEFENLLKGRQFIRVHRSYFVNFKKVTSINFDKNRVLIGDIEIPFSRKMKAALMKHLNLLK